MKIDKRTTEGKALLDEIDWNTRMKRMGMRDRIHSVSMILDSQLDQRIKQGSCKLCFYHDGVVGNGFTNYVCKVCGKADAYHDTRTPKICGECATDNGIRRYCMSDLNYNYPIVADERIYKVT